MTNSITVMDEVIQMHKLTLELLETLDVIAKRFFKYTNEYDIKIEGIDLLHRLTRKAERLIKEMSQPDDVSRWLTGDDMSHRVNRAIFRNIYILLPQVTFHR